MLPPPGSPEIAALLWGELASHGHGKAFDPTLSPYPCFCRREHDLSLSHRRLGHQPQPVMWLIYLISPKVHSWNEESLSPFVIVGVRQTCTLNRESRIMAKSSKRTAAAPAKDPFMGFRAAPKIRAKIVRWAEDQHDHPSLPEAVRRLVELGLGKSSPRKRIQSTRKVNAAWAVELASTAIDAQASPKATSAERKTRRRELLQGPGSFRRVRKDR